MEKGFIIFFASAFLLCSTAVVAQNNPDHLYLIGSGTPGNWSQDNSIDMPKINDNIFVWEGYLTKSADGDGFKFLEGNCGDGCWSPAWIFTESGFQRVTDGSDGKYCVDENGRYRIEVNTQAPYCKVTKLLYIVGEATAAGWTPANALGMNNISDAWWQWTGTLGNTDNGFKFLRNTDWFPQYCRKNGTDNQLFYKGASTEENGDLNFPVADGGYYFVEVVAIGINNNSYNVCNYGKLEHLYPIGSATTTGYPTVEALPTADIPSMTQSAENPAIFTASGVQLSAGEIKFLSTKDYAYPTVSPAGTTAGNIDVVSGEALPAKFATNAYGNPDKKFNITEAGIYDITIDLQANTVTFTKQPFIIEAGASRSANEYTSGNIIFHEGSQLTNIPETGLAVSGKVIYKRTFSTLEWHTIGFPFGISDVYVDDFKADADGGHVAAWTGSTGDYLLKAYSGDATFDFTQEWTAGKGYIIQFPSDFAGKEVSFISTDSPTLYNTATPITAVADGYSLIANPSVANTTNTSGITGAEHYYVFELEKENHFGFFDNEASFTLKPFESVIVTKGVTNLRSSVAVETPTEINVVPANDPIKEVRYYNLQGVEIAGAQFIAPTQCGVFIVKTVYQSGAVNVSKIIRK